MQQPCSRCKTRDRDCVYLRAPSTRTRRSNTLGSQTGPSSNGSPEEKVQRLPLAPDIPEDKPPSAASSSIGAHLDTINPSSSAPELYRSNTGATSSFPTSQSIVQVPFSSSSTFHDFRDPHDGLSSYSSSVLSDNTENNVAGIGGMYGSGTFAHDALEVNNQLNALFSTELFDKFFRDASFPDASEYPLDLNDMKAILEYENSQFPFPTNIVEMQPFMASMPPPGIDLLPLNQDFVASTNISTPNTLPNMNVAYQFPDPTLEPSAIPYPSEFQQYSAYSCPTRVLPDPDSALVHLFYSMFLQQMPIMHVATFTVTGKPSILISAMQACGALYVRTSAAMQFIDTTLALARDQLVGEFVSA